MKIKAIFFDKAGTIDNIYGKKVLKSFPNIEKVIVTNSLQDVEEVSSEFYNLSVVNPIVTTKYIPNIVNISDDSFIPEYIELKKQKANYEYKNKIDRLILTNHYDGIINENFILLYDLVILRKVKHLNLNNIDTVFKPDESIFHVARLHLTREYQWDEILMVGDSYHNDIVGGMKLGMKTLLIKNHEKLEYEISKIIEQ